LIETCHGAEEEEEKHGHESQEQELRDGKKATKWIKYVEPDRFILEKIGERVLGDRACEKRMN